MHTYIYTYIHFLSKKIVLIEIIIMIIVVDSF